MSRLIWVPQLPVKMRYQEWWCVNMVLELKNYFDSFVVLGESFIERMFSNTSMVADDNLFSSQTSSIDLEVAQIQEYMQLDFRDDDILLISDISYPGIFCNALFHKRPKKCFAICHASAKNKYDIWEPVAEQKWMQESGIANLLDGIFVATEYHKHKLKWLNTYIVGLPFLKKFEDGFPFYNRDVFELPVKNNSTLTNDIVSAARANKQKIDEKIESFVEEQFNRKIIRLSETDINSWYEYYSALNNARVLLVSAHEETFGYQIADAVLGANCCIPIAPRESSYVEMLPDRYLYDRHNLDELKSIINNAMTGELSKPDKLLCQGLVDNFYVNIAKIMLG